ncbi:hypothetical protein ACIRP2_23930 [Streptomyces sp. NPDC101194]|uniref:hypothetical protein n=1 Tax=Streptomyces sp. NPDC101194 TaxID=3366127 RepID=UPI00380ECE8A
MRIMRTVAGITLAGYLISACSAQPSYDYVISAKICDITIDRSLIKPLLPAGGKFEQTVRDYGTKPETDWVCKIEIDNEQALRIAFHRTSGTIDIPQLAREGSLKLRDPRDVDINGTSTAQIAMDGALLSSPCLSHGEEDLITELTLGKNRLTTKSVKDRNQEIETFLRSYVPGLIKAKCDA